jgi:hypothetical protein
VTEILYDDADQPYQFRAEADELREAIAEIPGPVLRQATEARWTRWGLEPPKRGVRELRRLLVAKCERAAERLSSERVLPVEKAAKHLGLTSRVLSYRVEQGEFEEAERELPNGRTGLAFKPPPKRWSLWVDMPDPRVLVHMVEAGIGPGGSFKFGYHGKEHTETYTRRRDGLHWKTNW